MATTATEGQLTRRIRIGNFRELNVLLALILLCIFFYAMKPDIFLRPANIAIILRFVATFGMLAIGEVLVIITRGIDLSVGSLTSLTGVITAWMILKGIDFLGISSINMFIAMPITLAVGVLVGLWHGFFVTRLKIPPFIITLGTWMIARGLAAYMTRGYPIVFPFDSPFLFFGQSEVKIGEILSIPVSFIILLIVAVIVSTVLRQTKLGYRIYAVGGNLEAARLSGINVNRVRLFCYATSGFLAAMTGILLASRLGQGTPVVGATYELWAIAAAVIGGTSLFGGEGTILGAILGAALVGVMQNGMILLNASSYLQEIILGAVLVIAVTYDTLRRRASRGTA